MAINANELRIGNWVESYVVMVAGSWFDKEGKIHGEDKVTTPGWARKITWEDLKILTEDKIGLATYRPIPLTPEILVKAGFKNMDDIFFIKYKELLLCLDKVWWWTNAWEADGEFEYNALAPYREITYVHELQNLYFAITQTELQIIPL